MKRTFAAAMMLGLMTAPVKAIEPPDGNRYPGWHNRMQGYQTVREPRWNVKRQRVARHKAGRKTARVTRARAIRAASPKRPPIVPQMSPQMGHTARLLADGAEAFTTPARFIRGRLICALNVHAALASRGIKGTGSALAKSYLRWGRPSRPVPGAVAVFNRGRRGGHVAIVHSVKPNGTVIYLNPSARRQTWVIGPYRKRPIAYRVAG